MKESREHINKELRDAGSKLAELTSMDMPVVPDGYFDQLEKDILNSTIYLPIAEQKGKVIGFSWIKYAAAIAAVFAIVFFGVKYFSNQNDISIELQLAGMSDEELDIYMNDQIATITADDLHTYITENINDIDAGLFAETKLISDDLSQIHLVDTENKILTNEVVDENEQPLLDKELFEQLDDETIEQLLNDESMFDDFAL